MKKRFSKVLIATTLFAGLLAGCSGGGEKAQEGGGAAGGSDAETIKLGLNFELSGPVATYGQSNVAGVELAVNEINESGGILGKQIEIVKIDNKSEAAESTNAAIKLTSQEKVVAMIGPSTSGATVAAAQIANDSKTPLITPSGTSPTVTVKEDGSVNEFVFRTSFIDPFQGTVAANFAFDNLKVKNAAVLADNSNDYSMGLAESFIETFKAAGGTIVAEEAYVAKDTDFRSTLTRLKGANPEFIFIPGYYEEVGLIVKQAREMGITVPLMGGDGWDSPTLLELAGADALNNTFVTNHYSAEDPDETIQKFVTLFKEKSGGKAPDAFNGLGYDTVYLLKDAIERAGSLDGTAIKDALAATKDVKLVTGTVTIDENHHPIKSTTVLEYKDGKTVFNTKVNP